MSAKGAAFVWDPSIASHVYRDDHPLKPKRLIGVHDTLKKLGAFDRPGARVLTPRPATRAEIERIHAPEYVEAVMQASREPDLDYSQWNMIPHLDTPPFKGMHEVSLLTTGGSLVAMEESLSGRVRAGVNFAGGLHHAMRRNASGFCIYNDPAIVCAVLADRGLKVAYVDIDAHHGDGVQRAFYETDQVLTISLHQYGFVPELGRMFFPGTGTAEERARAGKHCGDPSARRAREQCERAKAGRRCRRRGAHQAAASASLIATSAESSMAFRSAPVHAGGSTSWSSCGISAPSMMRNSIAQVRLTASSE